MNNRKGISQLRAEMLGVATRDFLTAEKFKKDREFWVLDKFLTNRQEQGWQPEPSYVEFGEGPDFDIYCDDSPRSRVCGIEVVEILEPGRRRGDELKSGVTAIDIEAPGPNYESEIVAHIKEALSKKFQKAYSSDTRLLVYLNLLRDIYFKLVQDSGPQDFDLHALRSALNVLSVPRRSGITQIWLIQESTIPEQVYHRV